MPIDKSPPWRAVSWAEKYPDDPDQAKHQGGLSYWMIENAAGYTVVSDWMTEEQARMIAGSPETTAALVSLINEVSGAWSAFAGEVRAAIGNTNYQCVVDKLGAARAAIAKATGKVP